MPDRAVDYCLGFYEKLHFQFQITRSRATKLGDYRYDLRTGRHKITVNNDLNPYAFLITYLHEVAHLNTFKKYGRKVMPHGAEWKKNFKNILLPVMKPIIFPLEVLHALENHLSNPRASSCTDPVLYGVLRKYDQNKPTLTLEDIEIGALFRFKNKIYRKIKNKRTRVICEEADSKRKYLIQKLAGVEKIQ